MISTTVQFDERNIHVGCCLFSHNILLKNNKKKEKVKYRCTFVQIVWRINVFHTNNQRSTSRLTRLLDQLAVYKDENNDKWFEKQRKMIFNHAINEKKRSS